MYFQLGCNKRKAKEKGAHLNVHRKEIQRASRLPRVPARRLRLSVHTDVVYFGR